MFFWSDLVLCICLIDLLMLLQYVIWISFSLYGFYAYILCMYNFFCLISSKYFFFAVVVLFSSLLSLSLVNFFSFSVQVCGPVSLVVKTLLLDVLWLVLSPCLFS